MAGTEEGAEKVSPHGLQSGGGLRGGVWGRGGV